MQLRNENLVVSSANGFKILKLKENSYDILQEINYDGEIMSFEELANDSLSILYYENKNITLFKKKDDKYSFDYKISFDGKSLSLNVEGKENELLYSYYKEVNDPNYIYIFDCEKKKT